MIFILLGALTFVALGIWLFTISNEVPGRNPLFVKLASIAATAFFGLAAVVVLKKLFDNSPGLIINSKGIFDNAGGTSAGLIPWDQMTDFSILVIRGQQILAIYVRDPKPYLDKGNFLRRVANKANYKYYGTPVCISSNGLKTNFNELVKNIERYFERHGNDQNVMQ